ncbi:siroheme synthase [Sphingomonas sp. SUN019]|uniref:precorrin-2 dehydrogenase/sirohydrochlorin ferrochelatase family protein n=1 Tax=Sphingomonas sp. SUN019 TaxID=2937788 RepID=UPI002164E950|nr:siroheme synthase [Sphingomonas sp. SUN019]UVO51206.1 siroheme synthase [Sphingomonas sp. SUN019]
MTLHSLPLFVRLEGRPVILLGEGSAAEAKRRLLERAGAVIVGEDAQAALAIVALDAPEEAVARLRGRGVLVNAVDRPDLCDFTLPAIVDRDPVLVAIGTGGVSAGLAAALRQRLEAMLPVGLGALAEALFASRRAIKGQWPDAAARRRALADAMRAGGALDLLAEARADESRAPISAKSVTEGVAPQSGSLQLGPGRRRGGAQERVEDWIAAAGDARGSEVVRISLHSADPDELTLRQARALANADRVTHRADVPRAILDRARADADRFETDAPPIDPSPGLTVDVEMSAATTSARV